MHSVRGSHVENRFPVIALMQRRRTLVLSFLSAVVAAAATQGQIPRPRTEWFAAGSGVVLSRELAFENSSGRLGVLNADGPIATKGHPFFEALGPNGRACVTCHQPSNAMSLSLEAIRERWRVTKGKDPLFAAIDGSDNPSAAQDRESSHSLLLNRALFRVGLPWPPEQNQTPEFTIEIVARPDGSQSRSGMGAEECQTHDFRFPAASAGCKSQICSCAG